LLEQVFLSQQVCWPFQQPGDSMKTLLSAAMLFALFLLVGCGGTPEPEPIEGPDQAEELTEEEEATEMELNEGGGDDV
jgi:hypothetical protein